MRRGFTLVELLTTIAIIGILVGLLFPAVQMIRSSARLSSCKNNLRQVSLALVHYESAHQVFPPGQLCPTDETIPKNPLSHQLVGHLGYAFPFLEQDNLFQTFSPINWSVDAIEPTPWFESEDMWDATSTPSNVFRCPSDRSNSTWRIHMSSFYLDGARHNFSLDSPKIDGHRGWTNYLGCSGDVIGAQALGIFFGRSKVSHRDITDGLSNTVLAGETAGSTKNDQEFDLSSDQGYRASIMMNGLGADFGFFEEIPNDNQITAHLTFSSRHPGKIANLSRCDGSVFGVAANIDRTTLIGLMTRNQGEVNQE